MKERFSKIFELWNQRNTEYYQEVFEKLEKENKLTFNFAAAFFNVMWLIFRKMYGWAILLGVINTGLKIFLRMLCPSLPGLTVFLIMFVIFGFFGNTLYYKRVKFQVSKGYANMPDYNPIDPISGIFVVIILNFAILMLPVVLAGTYEKKLILILVSSFVIAVSWAINYRKFHSQESGEPIEVTEESVNQYLKKSSSKYLAVYFITMFLLYELTICSFLMLQVHKSYALRQLNKMSRLERTTRTTYEEASNDFLKKFHLTKDDGGF